MTVSPLNDYPCWASTDFTLACFRRATLVLRKPKYVHKDEIKPYAER